MSSSGEALAAGDRWGEASVEEPEYQHEQGDHEKDQGEHQSRGRVEGKDRNQNLACEARCEEQECRQAKAETGRLSDSARQRARQEEHESSQEERRRVEEEGDEV